MKLILTVCYGYWKDLLKINLLPLLWLAKNLLRWWNLTQDYRQKNAMIFWGNGKSNKNKLPSPPLTRLVSCLQPSRLPHTRHLWCCRHFFLSCFLCAGQQPHGLHIAFCFSHNLLLRGKKQKSKSKLPYSCPANKKTQHTNRSLRAAHARKKMSEAALT